MYTTILVLFFLLLHHDDASAVDNVNILGLFRDKVILKVDGKQRILSAGQTSPEGISLISSSSKEAILEIDGVRDTYTLGSHIGSSYKKPEKGNISTIAPDAQGMYWVNGSINGYQVDFVVDTGATFISMNRNEARRMGLEYKLNGIESQSSTAAGLSKVYLVKLARIRVGDIEINDVDGAVHDSDYPEVILLGNSFLNRVNMNRNGKILQLQER